MVCWSWISLVFFFNATAPTELYTLSLHDALPISLGCDNRALPCGRCEPGIGMGSLISGSGRPEIRLPIPMPGAQRPRSEEHTSELQSRPHLVCRLLLEKKKKKKVTQLIKPQLTTH